ncbi:MAG: hypothetical protein AB2L14_24845 [Candidatus Xenobiia bacterium LiM19]
MADTPDTIRGLQFHTVTPTPEKMKGFFSRGFVNDYQENRLTGEKNMTVLETSPYHNGNIRGYRFMFEGYNRKMKMDTMNVQIIVPDKNESSLIFLTTSVQQQFYSQYERELEGFFNSLTL